MRIYDLILGSDVFATLLTMRIYDLILRSGVFAASRRTNPP
jgi:hypothetical protein